MDPVKLAIKETDPYRKIPRLIAILKAGSQGNGVCNSKVIAECQRICLQHDENTKRVRELDRYIQFQLRERVNKYRDQWKVFVVEDGETHWVVARDEKEAKAAYLDCFDDGEEIEEISHVAGDAAISIRMDDGSGEEKIKTAAEWVIESTENNDRERFVLASSVW